MLACNECVTWCPEVLTRCSYLIALSCSSISKCAKYALQRVEYLCVNDVEAAECMIRGAV
jgi:hypothetical protein